MTLRYYDLNKVRLPKALKGMACRRKTTLLDSSCSKVLCFISLQPNKPYFEPFNEKRPHNNLQDNIAWYENGLKMRLYVK